MHMHLTVYTSALQVRIEAQVQRFLDTLYSGARPTDDQVWFGRPELPLLAIHVRAQDSTHRTDVMSLGTKSRRRIQAAVQRCAACAKKCSMMMSSLSTSSPSHLFL